MIGDLSGAGAAWPILLEANNEVAEQTSLLDEEKFARMIRAATVALYVPPASAFLLAFAAGDAYEGVHFKWFSERSTRFLYVDRIVVAAAARRQGLGAVLYETLFARARALGYERIACEVNLFPANPVSDAFHAAFDFREIDRATSADRAKTVRYLVRELV
jgi:predicted GNAT superfamily acetyltransferase